MFLIDREELKLALDRVSLALKLKPLLYLSYLFMNSHHSVVICVSGSCL